MAEILGLGVTHYPGLLVDPPYWSRFTERGAETGRIPAEVFADVDSWPAPMRAEWSDDKGARAAGEHRDRLVAGFREVRRALDAFDPDFVVIWGDDQYENFIQDCIPAFCVYMFAESVSRPFERIGGTFGADENAWRVPEDTEIVVHGHRDGGRALCAALIEDGFDVAYAYETRHRRGLAHSFINTAVFLDHDRAGFPYPVVPFHVNCYGNQLMTLADGSAQGTVRELAPPSPSPRRCFDIGRATARRLADSPWRVALIASSSWSHANLTAKTRHLYPDLAADRVRFEEIKSGAFSGWGEIALADIEDAGQHEFLNWICLAGAMTELGRRFEAIDFVESHLFNSSKCFGVFPPA